jgi:hypothetical protein
MTHYHESCISRFLLPRGLVVCKGSLCEFVISLAPEVRNACLAAGLHLKNGFEEHILCRALTLFGGIQALSLTSCKRLASYKRW